MLTVGAAWRPPKIPLGRTVISLRASGHEALKGRFISLWEVINVSKPRLMRAIVAIEHAPIGDVPISVKKQPLTLDSPHLIFGQNWFGAKRIDSADRLTVGKEHQSAMLFWWQVGGLRGKYSEAINFQVNQAGLGDSSWGSSHILKPNSKLIFAFNSNRVTDSPNTEKVWMEKHRRDRNPRPFRIYDCPSIRQSCRSIIRSGFGSRFGSSQTPEAKQDTDYSDKNEGTCECDREAIYPISPYRHGGKFADSYGLGCIVLGYCLCVVFAGWGTGRLLDGFRLSGSLLFCLGVCCNVLATGSVIVGCLPWDWGRCLHDGQEHSHNSGFHSAINVSQKHLTSYKYCNTVIAVDREATMANILPKDKQIAVIGALAEGSSIRSIERITGVHRDTVMRLGVRVGKGCEMLLDSKMQDLGCRYLQFDEVWGFIGKKERHVRIGDDPELGDVWTYCAIDAETKLVPCFKVGKRNLATTTAFVQDVASRMRNRVQISTDALHGYVEAVERSFGADVDYGQIVKVYVHDDAQHPERKYSAPHFASAMRRPIVGEPDMELVSTSHVERLNATTRLHMRRLTRLTLAFSKKLENFQAAVALHFAYYNFVKRHNTLRCTPAMAAGVERDFWTVGDLVEAAA